MATSPLMPAPINTVSASSCLARPRYSSVLARRYPHSSCTRTSDDRGFINVSNGSRVHCMQVVNPFENKRFETLSYVPPLSSEQIVKQIESIVFKGWIPCLEFDKRGEVFRENSRRCGYYDGRYWTMWKLPMFGCRNPVVVLREVEECKATYPNAYIRMMAFDNKRQVQCVAFLVQRPSSTSK